MPYSGAKICAWSVSVNRRSANVSIPQLPLIISSGSFPHSTFPNLQQRKSKHEPLHWKQYNHNIIFILKQLLYVECDMYCRRTKNLQCTTSRAHLASSFATYSLFSCLSLQSHSSPPFSTSFMLFWYSSITLAYRALTYNIVFSHTMTIVLTSFYKPSCDIHHV